MPALSPVGKHSPTGQSRRTAGAMSPLTWAELPRSSAPWKPLPGARSSPRPSRGQARPPSPAQPAAPACLVQAGDSCSTVRLGLCPRTSPTGQPARGAQRLCLRWRDGRKQRRCHRSLAYPEGSQTGDTAGAPKADILAACRGLAAAHNKPAPRLSGAIQLRSSIKSAGRTRGPFPEALF